MFSAGQVAATLRGNFSPAGFMAFDAAMKKSAATMSASEKQMVASSSRGSKAMGAMGKAGALAAVGGVLVLGAALKKSVGLAADFEEQLSRLKATTGANSAQMKRFKKDAMEAGAATKFSALDAAKAQVELAKGGLAVKDMSGGLKAALGLAAAGEIDLAVAAETVVNAMKQFKIPGGEAVHVADALATAANTTTADVHHFAMALTQGGAAAKNAGMNLDETVAILEAFADNSVKGSDAGTSMKAMLTQLAAPTDKQANAAKRLNLELWDQQGNLKPLPAMAKALDGAFGGLTNKQRLAAAATIAGTDGMRGLLALYSSSPQAMQGYLDGLKEEGTAAEVAATKQDNLRGKIENLKGSLETAGIQLGEGLLPGLTKGAEKLTESINEMAASGQLEKLGADIGDLTASLAEATPAMVEFASATIDAFGGLGKALSFGFEGTKAMIDAILGGLTTVMGAVKVAGEVFNFLPGPDIDLGGLQDAIDGINEYREGLARTPKDVTLQIKGDPSQATAALKKVQSMGLSAKVMKILGKDISAAAKVRQIEALGIPAKIAKILGENGDAIAKIGSVQAALNALRNRTVLVNVRRIGETLDSPGRVTKKPPVPGLKGEATGSPGGYSRTALVGEGRGPELVTDGSSSIVVSSPTLMDLGPEHSVIPFGDPAQKGRALGLMLQMFGIEGYAKGKKAKRKPKASPKSLPVPAAVQFGAVPEDELNKSRDDARESYQKRKRRVHDLGVDIREQRKKVAEAKGPDAKRKARSKLADLQKDHRRYKDGGDGLASLGAMRKRWQELQKQATVLRTYNREIARLDTMQETDRTKMATASKTGDADAWGDAKRHRGGILATLKEKYAKALQLAKPGSNFAAELEGKLAGIESEIADIGTEAFTVESPFEGGMSDAERKTLEGLEAAQSLAALTADLGDDKATAGSTLGFLESILGATLADPARGGAAAIRDIADRVKQARDNVASFAGGSATSNDNADLQAQLDQAREATRVAKRESEINAKGLATFQGAGDIGMGGRTVQNIYTLHPGDPNTLRAIGDAATAGMGLQPYVGSSRTNLGI